MNAETRNEACHSIDTLPATLRTDLGKPGQSLLPLLGLMS